MKVQRILIWFIRKLFYADMLQHTISSITYKIEYKINGNNNRDLLKEIAEMQIMLT